MGLRPAAWAVHSRDPPHHHAGELVAGEEGADEQDGGLRRGR